MMIRRLDLKAYGRFTDVSLDLSAGPHRFHLIYGPNESGKSTSLRAITALLFGMPHQAEDAYVHPANKLRVGGVLRGDDGVDVEVLRRRGRQKTLRQPNDTDVIDDSVLQQMIGSIDLETFKRQFGLSHDELVRGGAAILSGGGDLGAILFAAGAGISRLKDVQSQLSSQSESLYKRGGTKGRLNQAIREFDESSKRLKALQVSPSEFERLQDELKQKSELVATSEASLRERQTELTRLTAYRKALHLSPKWQDLQAKLLEMKDVPVLDSAFTERRRKYAPQHAIKSQSLAALQRQRSALNAELEALSEDNAALSCSVDIERLYQNLGAVQKAREELVGLNRSLTELDRSMIDALCELAIDVSEENEETRDQLVDESVRRLRLTDANRSTINSLAQSYGGIVQRRDQAEQTVEVLKRRVYSVESELEELGTPADPEKLRRVIDSVGSPDTRLDGLAKQSADVARLERKCNQLLGRLVGFDGTAKQAAKLVLPSASTIDRVTKRLDDADSTLAAARAKLEQLASDKDAVSQRLRHEKKTESLPTIRELDDARQKRNETIDDLANAASTGDVGVQDINQLRAQVAYADQLIDKIRVHGEAIHRRAAEQAKLELIDEQMQNQQSVVEVAFEESSDANEEWRALWGKIEVVADTTKRMQRWVGDHERLVECVSQWESESARLRTLENQVAAAGGRLREAIESTRFVASVPASSATASDAFSGGLFDREVAMDDLTTLYDDAIDLHRALSEKVSRCKSLCEKREGLKEELLAEEANAETSQQKVQQWDRDWDEATSAFIDPSDRRPEVVVSLISKIDALCDQRKDRNDRLGRIRSLSEDEQKFREDAIRVAESLELCTDRRALDAEGISRIVQDMFARLREERKREDRRESLSKRLVEANRDIADTQQQVDELNVLLDALCREAGCDDIDSLVRIEGEAQQRREVEASLESVTDQLRILAAGDELESFVQRTSDQDVGVLDASIADLELQLNELREQREAVLQEVGAIRGDLQRIDGSDEAAALRQSIQFSAGQISSLTQRYAQSRTALLILREAIEDYRQQNQGPVLGYAKDLFTELTCGRYESLRVDHNEKGLPILVGVRPGDGIVVRAEDMSTGTADTLYLSLRLASLRHQLTQGITMPLIVDDCLVQLDDERASAALRAFSKLSTHTQVILFTHHEHLLDLAGETLGNTEFHVHKLDELAALSP